jgi:surface protein
MRDEEDEYDDDGNIINPDHDGGIRTAARVWFADPAAAKARYGLIASWDVSEVTDLSYLFERQAGFNEDLSRWDVSNVVNMSYMFAGTSYNGDLSSWNVSSVVHMHSMFEGATSFNGDLSRWNVSNVVNMNGMFLGATSYNGDLSSWDVSSVVEMNWLFAGATSFNRRLGGAWSTSTAYKDDMFRNSPGTIAGKTKLANGTIE